MEFHDPWEGSTLTPLLVVENLGRRLGDRWLWQQVSFELAAGEALGISGASGTGKSLLLRSLVGLDPIDAGSVMFQGRFLKQWDIPRLRRSMIYLMQTPGLIEGTVEDNLRAVMELRSNGHSPYSRDRVLEILQTCNRDAAFLRQSVARLSGGERQLLALVRALQIDPIVLLLDEPTAALDPDTTRQVEALISQWQQQQPQRSYLWVSHSADQLQRMSHRTLTLPILS
ncbi:ABC transporter ATP-binding protein [Lyngbya confervoides]|uniref:ATP-binding cassette domain-containing protein n=1 Tax=Lyngbya confervoides BDU141951 TaxID=1574623 RepID=A0ABD4T967_9CYAN|nr:ATP-binding cassette domain-containing protein [Lyngbya confervoides]MCM1985156.1 ATP-binding cassette domain-containing protein [Lyngbya confervoides BDU141951]